MDDHREAEILNRLLPIVAFDLNDSATGSRIVSAMCIALGTIMGAIMSHCAQDKDATPELLAELQRDMMKLVAKRMTDAANAAQKEMAARRKAR